MNQNDVVDNFLKAVGTYICPCGRCSTNRISTWAEVDKNLEKCPNENDLWHTDLENNSTEVSDTCDNSETSSDTLVWRAKNEQ